MNWKKSKHLQSKYKRKKIDVWDGASRKAAGFDRQGWMMISSLQELCYWRGIVSGQVKNTRQPEIVKIYLNFPEV